jgi:alkylhydroperoxidase/carboxymuconolactone decarboxylase family protein YurZ
MQTTDAGERSEALREAFIAERGFWSDTLQAMLDADPRFFAAYLELSAHAARRGVLEPKVREFVLIAVDAATTHLFAPGIKAHIETALALGATPQEIMEVLEITSVIGVHACSVGVPILLEELAAAGLADEPAPLTERQEEVKARFVQLRGSWGPSWEDLLRLDAEFLAAYTEFSGVPWEHGVLPAKVKELIYIAFDASATHLYEPGIRQHVRLALSFGATKEEIMEVLELASVIGIHTCLVGVPLLQDAVRDRAKAAR